MNKILSFKEFQECPSVNGIVFPNGDIQCLDVSGDMHGFYQVHKKDSTSISELKLNDKLYWNDCSIITSLIDDVAGVEILAGEGDYGSDGFVGVLEIDTYKLLWIAFFENSNPFVELKIFDRKIVAKSNLGVNWTFDIDNPLDVIVKKE